MSKGSIVDCKIKIRTSEKLNEFIASLNNCDQMPATVFKIYERYTKQKSKKSIIDEEIEKHKYGDNEIKILKDISLSQKNDCLQNLLIVTEEETEEDDKNTIENIESIIISNSKKSNKKDEKQLNNKKKEDENLHLFLNDLRWINKILIEKRNAKQCDYYLHELIEDCKLILPKNEIIPRNPTLEARCQKLREEQNAREYRNMTKDVDSSRRHLPDDTIAFQIKSINRQLIAVLQFVFSVLAGFAFGFLGVELIIGNLDFGFRLLLGIMCALIIALAEIYFLAKKLIEYDDISQYDTNTKPHQD